MTDRSSQPTPKVSVIIPVHHVDDALRRTLLVLEQQTAPFAWELVVGLNTASASERRSLCSILDALTLSSHIVDASAKKGPSFARNAAAATARGSHLAFCDSDDEAEPDWLETLVAAHEPGTAIGGQLAEERLVPIGQENWRPRATPGDLPTFLGAPYLVSANMAIWKTDFEAVGGFDDTLLAGHDIDFGWRLLEHNVDLRYCAGAIVHYRHRVGLRALLEQHYSYGRGMSRVLARRQPPGVEHTGRSLLLKANGQTVEHQTPVHVLRRGAIAAGRVHGLLDFGRVFPSNGG